MHDIVYDAIRRKLNGAHRCNDNFYYRCESGAGTCRLRYIIISVGFS